MLFFAFSDAAASRHYALMASLLAFSLTTFAQTQPLTITGAVALAREKNRDLQIANLAVAKASQRTREARGAALPTVSGFGQYVYNIQRPVSFLPGNFAGLADNQIANLRVGGDQAFVGSVGVYQPLFQAGVKSGIRAAGIDEVRSTADAAVTASNVVTAVRKAYLNVLITEEQLQLQQQSLGRNVQALRDARSLLLQGRASRVDTLRAYVNVENLRPEILRLSNGIAIAKTVLATTIGLEANEPLMLQDSLHFDDKAQPLTSEQAYAEALEKRPELRQLKLTEELNQEQIRLASTAGRPQLAATGLVQTQAQAYNLRLGDYQWPVSSYVGVQVSVPIYSGGRVLARTEQARITRQQTERELANQQELIRAEVLTSVSSVQEARRRVESQKQTVAAAALGYRITRDRWRAGMASRLDLTDAELSLTRTKLGYLQAVYDYQNAAIDLDRAVGRTPSQ
ncbi:TolC family protein [Hymenobacter negativus]|uniref:TolC family protein n=1 Tax=Hymenobacter negativus TaxID=2795026 RepID=A0ABS3QIM1_9BACT|nr:TolC family protein [Hymenobacter negativus]MBO2011089.1 TolC family protein [Hymenobacter negativus]